jgi:hypothetical protein
MMKKKRKCVLDSYIGERGVLVVTNLSELLPLIGRRFIFQLGHDVNLPLLYLQCKQVREVVVKVVGLDQAFTMPVLLGLPRRSRKIDRVCVLFACSSLIETVCEKLNS